MFTSLPARCDNVWKELSIGETHYRLSAQGLYWGLIPLYPLPDMYLNPRLPEGNGVFGKHRIIYRNSSGPVNHPYQFMVGTF